MDFGWISQATWPDLTELFDACIAMDLIQAEGYFNMIAWRLLASGAELDLNFAAFSQKRTASEWRSEEFGYCAAPYIAGAMSNAPNKPARATRRPRTNSAVTRGEILDAAERVMVEEGYAAVTTRRVAERCGLKPPLVHYHFKTTDDLLIALYRRGAEQSLQRHASALAQDDPLTAMWRTNSDNERTALALEFMAMANHRKFIREEIARYAEQIRAIQVATLERYLRENGLEGRPFSPLALSVILAGVARGLVLESRVGIQLGHEEAKIGIAELLAGYFVKDGTEA